MNRKDVSKFSVLRMMEFVVSVTFLYFSLWPFLVIKMELEVIVGIISAGKTNQKKTKQNLTILNS